jgi:hypothetical protein
MVNIGDLYGVLIQISVDRQTMASQNMHTILDENKRRERKAKNGKQLGS